MQETQYISIISNRKKIVLRISTILYIVAVEKHSEIHISGGVKYQTKMSLRELEGYLEDGFIKIHRGCLVSAKAIYSIDDKINLSNGESLEYTVRKKKQIIEQFHKMRRRIIISFSEDMIPSTKEEYQRYYSGFDKLPFAFADIEMVFDEDHHAVDWIFRYGNPALARLEKRPLSCLIDSCFSSLYPNMDTRWLKSYERSTLYGEILEMIDYSPEIDTYLKIICFPTFRGHCGCILFDIDDIEYVRSSPDAENALISYLGKARLAYF